MDGVQEEEEEEEEERPKRSIEEEGYAPHRRMIIDVEFKVS